MKKGLFIVFSGGEGSGKTTQAKLLYDYLLELGRDVLLTKEPGGDEGVCRDIRKILLNTDYQSIVSPRAELLLFEADRAQHVDSVLVPALKEGKIVISDRFDPDTFAYQCGGRKVCGLKDIKILNDFATRGFYPDFYPNFYFWFDIDPKTGLDRNLKTGKRDRFEMEDLSFHQGVRDGFNVYFNQLVGPDRWKKLDAEKSIQSLHQEVVATLKSKHPA